MVCLRLVHGAAGWMVQTNLRAMAAPHERFIVLVPQRSERFVDNCSHRQARAGDRFKVTIFFSILRMIFANVQVID